MATVIPLTQGRSAVVDDEDAARVRQYRWRFDPYRRGTGYAVADIGPRSCRKNVRLHRFILDAPDGMFVDHIDGDGLNNQRANLRLVTRSQNMQNRYGAQSNSRTGIRGVRFRPKCPDNPYSAYIKVAGRTHVLGSFPTAEAADEAAKDGRRRLMTHASECRV